MDEDNMVSSNIEDLNTFYENYEEMKKTYITKPFLKGRNNSQMEVFLFFQTRRIIIMFMKLQIKN